MCSLGSRDTWIFLYEARSESLLCIFHLYHHCCISRQLLSTMLSEVIQADSLYRIIHTPVHDAVLMTHEINDSLCSRGRFRQKGQVAHNKL